MIFDGRWLRADSFWKVALRPVVAAAGAVALLCVLYTGLLGFGVNERCTSVARCRSADCQPCDRLDSMAWEHGGIQVALVTAAALLAIIITRRTSGWRMVVLNAVVAGTWFAAAIVAIVTYTNAAWSWANSPM